MDDVEKGRISRHASKLKYTRMAAGHSTGIDAVRRE
jgi:hypothetical protein